MRRVLASISVLCLLACGTDSVVGPTLQGEQTPASVAVSTPPAAVPPSPVLEESSGSEIRIVDGVVTFKNLTSSPMKGRVAWYDATVWLAQVLVGFEEKLIRPGDTASFSPPSMPCGSTIQTDVGGLTPWPPPLQGGPPTFGGLWAAGYHVTSACPTPKPSPTPSPSPTPTPKPTPSPTPSPTPPPCEVKWVEQPKVYGSWGECKVQAHDVGQSCSTKCHTYRTVTINEKNSCTGEIRVKRTYKESKDCTCPTGGKK